MAKPIRTAAALCLTLSFRVARAGKRASFISAPPIDLVFGNLVPKQGFLFREGSSPPKDSNNPLAVELESENDPAC
jgi:hypothetical protein